MDRSPVRECASPAYLFHVDHINGDFRNVAKLIVLNGTVVGGCDISVTQVNILGGAGVQGQVEITPHAGVTIERFGVGGQEFYIDDVCWQ